MTARELMTPNPVTVTVEESLVDAWDLMRELDIRHVPVVQDGALVGMLSDRDLGHLDMTRMAMGEGADAVTRELAKPIIDVMRSDVIFVEPETGLNDVIALLIEHKVGALPVVQPDTRELLGIVSYIAARRAIQDSLEEA